MDGYLHLLNPVFEIAKLAGNAVMRIYKNEDDLHITLKSDNTPVTLADFTAHDIIVEHLKKLTPHIPVLSEESADIPFEERQTWTRYWLVDPVDGTKEFIDHTDEFSINIALIDHHEAVLGVIYAPALGVGYKASRGFGAFKCTQEETHEYLQQSHSLEKNHPVRVTVSRRHGRHTKTSLELLGKHVIVPCGSALKFGLVAEGIADIYLRLGNTSEWDTAAGQCILEEAGGRVFDLNGDNLRYNTKDSLVNSEFLAVNDLKKDWMDILSKF